MSAYRNSLNWQHREELAQLLSSYENQSIIWCRKADRLAQAQMIPQTLHF